MDVTLETWPLVAVLGLLGAVLGALWLFRRQVARDKDMRAGRLERALASARRAAGRISRDRRPRRWVRAQMQLAMLLAEEGGDRPGRAPFEEALAILAEAIPILKAQGLTPELATAIYYKGRAEWGLGGLEPGWGRLETAVATFRELLAIEPWPRHLLRGVVVSLPAVILIDIGHRADDVAVMEEGVALARRAVAEARPRTPIDKSIALRNLSHALGMLGRRTENPAMLEEAVEVARAAIDGIKGMTFPGHRMACEANLGHALGALGELRGDAALLEDALAMLEGAGEQGDAKGRPMRHVMLAQNTGSVLLTLGRLRRDPAMLRRAARDIGESLDALDALAQPFARAETARMLGHALAALAEIEPDDKRRERAADHYRTALEIFTHAGATRHAADTGEAIRQLENPGTPGADYAVTRHQPVYIVR